MTPKGPGINAKAKGTRNEHRSLQLLEAAGYRCTRSAASLGCWDLVGVSASGFVLCQVKSNRGPSPMERLGLEEFRVPRNCKKLIHVWKDRARSPITTEV